MPERAADDALRQAAEQLRADAGRVHADTDSSLDQWIEVVDDAVYSLRRAGWTVEAP